MEALAAALRFPDYFGKNWDAVADCLRDLPDAFPGAGHVLFIRNGLRLWQAAPAEAARLVEVWLSAAGEASPPCADAADADDDGAVALADVLTILNYLFLDGPPPRPPFPQRGPDPTSGDGLECEIEA